MSGRDMYSKYSGHLDSLLFEIVSNGVAEMYPDVREYLKQPELKMDWYYKDKALKYAIEKHNVELLDILKFNYDHDYYKTLKIGTKTIQALYDFMQDTYGLTVSQYTADEVNKLIKAYIQESKIKDAVYQQSFHISFDITLEMQAKDKDTALKILRDKVKSSVKYYGMNQENLNIQEIS